MSVTRIDEHQTREVEDALLELLERHRRTGLRAFAFTIKTGPRRHRIGITGDYWTDPAELLAVATRMEYKANQLISSRDDDPETSSMPL